MSPTEISRFRDEYDFLSNFYPCNITYDGLKYGSVEVAFQAAKCSDTTERQKFTSLNPGYAKKLGKEIELRNDWESVKKSVMWELLVIKFINNPTLMKKLIETGDTRLIEGNSWHDNYWGDCECLKCKDVKGQNVLGELLMQIRKRQLQLLKQYITL